MSVTVHRLQGCAPTPLAHYLKALGILRLVATQADPKARGFWRDDVFHLATALDHAALLDFFLSRYQPTPLLAPWNGGSGFYPKDNKEGIDTIAQAEAARFAPYRDAIARARQAVTGRKESPKDEEKERLVQRLRQEWTGGALEWLNAAVVLSRDKLEYPALLGTGGNDGRLDFTNNQMQRLVELFDPGTGAARPDAPSLLELALFGTPAHGLLADRAIGQYLPGAAGGANATAGFSGTSLINPWDFVLTFEGAVVLQVAAVRRLEGAGLAQAAAPFAVRGRAAGYGSAASADESARGEQWMPLWSGPALLSEVSALFAEGRLQTGPRRAQTALDAARALARLGAARGITAFERYGFIERNGQANLAVPLGRWAVRNDPLVQLVDEIEPWVDGLRRTLNAKGTPASIERLVRRIEGALFDVLRNSGQPEAWRELLCQLGAAEDDLVRRPKWTAEQSGLGPLPRLSPGWVTAAWGDGAAELRLAAAIASQRAPMKRGGGERLGTIRANCLPLDLKSLDSKFPRFAAHGGSPGVVWRGRVLDADLAAIVQRRLIDGEREGVQGFPLVGRIFPSLDDLSGFLLGETDDRRIALLARGLMAVDWQRRGELGPLPVGGRERNTQRLSALHALFRLCYLPPEERGAPKAVIRFRDGRSIDLDKARGHPDPVPFRYLMAGRLEEAVDRAAHRLTIRGLRPRFHFGFGDAALAQRLAASLAIPVSPEDLKTLGYLVAKPDEVLIEKSPHETAPLPSET